MAAPSSMPKNFAGATCRFTDGTSVTPVALIIPLFNGDFSLAPLGEHLNEDVFYDTRTANAGIGIGAPVRPTLAFTALVGNIIGNSSTAPGSPLEFAHRKGAYAANVSTLGANRLTTIDVRLSIEGTAWGDTADETIDCEDVRVSADFAMAADGNTLSFSGTVTGNIIVTNSANVVTWSPFPI